MSRKAAAVTASRIKTVANLILIATSFYTRCALQMRVVNFLVKKRGNRGY